MWQALVYLVKRVWLVPLDHKVWQENVAGKVIVVNQVSPQTYRESRELKVKITQFLKYLDEIILL